MPIVLDGIAGITTPEIVSTGGPLVVNASAPDNSVVVDASGNVGIGTSSPARALAVNGIGKFMSTVTLGGSVTSTDFGAYLTNEAFANNNDSNTATLGTSSARSLIFATNNTERWRIDSNGLAAIGGVAVAGSAERLRIRGTAANSSSGNPLVMFDVNDVGRSFFMDNGGLGNFSANNINLSDRREKTNFAPAKSYLNTICAIPVQTFNYIDQNHEEDPGLTLGVVAQDVQEVAPEMVMESNWGTAEEPKQRLSIYQTDLQYALMKSIQELKAINDAQAQTIESLTARVVALEQA